MRIRFFIAMAMVALSFPAALSAAADTGETIVTPAARTALGLTVYNDNLALVRDERTAPLHSGKNILRFTDITDGVNPASVLIEQSPVQALDIHEVDYDADTPNWNAMLLKSIGKPVRIRRVRQSTGEPILSSGILLNVSGGRAVVETNGALRNVAKTSLLLDPYSSPRQLRPSLAISGTARTAANSDMTLTYMTRGLTWRADYAGRLNADETTLGITGFVTLANSTGAAFKNATVRVVAGNVNRTARPVTRRVQLSAMKMEAAADRRETTVSDVHVISLGKNLSLRPNQTKQFALFKAIDIPITKEYRLENRGVSYNRAYRPVVRDQPIIRLVFKNDAKSGLDRVLPAGVLRLYAQEGGAPLFLGESSMPHTPRGEIIRLTTGRAFEINAERRQTAYTRSGLPKGVIESSHEIIIRNAKATAVTVTVSEHIPGDWRMLSESHAHENPQSNQAIWRVKVPAAGEAKLAYSVRVQF
jgi:hypothetical protein